MKLHGFTRKSGAVAALALLLAPAVLLAPAATPASAHHSAAPFDLTRQISMRGTVERWVWSNPHSWLYIRVQKADGTTEVWGLEGGSTNALVRSGWNARDMRPGDQVTIGANPSRAGNRVALLNRVELPSGRVLTSGFGAPPPGAGGGSRGPGNR